MAETRVRIPVAVLVTPREYGAFVIPEAAWGCQNCGLAWRAAAIYRLARPARSPQGESGAVDVR
jgi:hypothetical protein